MRRPLVTAPVERSQLRGRRAQHSIAAEGQRGDEQPVEDQHCGRDARGTHAAGAGRVETVDAGSAPLVARPVSRLAVVRTGGRSISPRLEAAIEIRE
jgi:hypothetical protein